jgi:prophage regulatory protein
MIPTRIRLVGAHEIRMRLGGVSRQRVYQITGPDFP